MARRDDSSAHVPFVHRLLSGIALYAFALHPTLTLANPVGGEVKGGAATISTQGTTLTVKQHTDKAIIDWRGFDIGVGETTQFQQPSASAIALNRVNSGPASQIMGTLQANGNVVLINPNGVLFGAGSKVDVAGLVATTSDLSNADFMAGRFHFTKPGQPDASIIQRGSITARDAGLVGLVAPHVENSGIIQARLGKVALASGDRFTLDLHGDNLINIAVSDPVASQLVKHSGTIAADGGEVLITAAAARDTVNSLIDVSGDVSATRIEQKGGRIVIHGQGANGTSVDGASTVLVSGDLTATGNKQGGTIKILGDKVAAKRGSVIDASGNKSGGTIHIGGEYLGRGDTPRATHTVIQKDATIKANGGHGEVIAWSDEYTDFSGRIEANGGSGFVETSSKNTLNAIGSVQVSGGRWLLDPGDITVQDAGVTNTLDTDGPLFEAPAGTASIVTTGAIELALFGTNGTDGADVTIQTGTAGAGNGDIFINNDIDYLGTVGRSLTFKAARSISMTNADITSANAALHTILWSDYDAPVATAGAGDITLTNSSISSNSGNIFLVGGLDDGANGGTAGDNIGDHFAWGVVNNRGINIDNSALNAVNGAILMRGQGGGNGEGVHIHNGASLTVDQGNISIAGIARGSNSNSVHIAAPIVADEGNITINGNASGGAGTDTRGVYILNDITSASGDITIQGISTGTANGIDIGTNGTDIGSAAMAGNILLRTDSFNIQDTTTIRTDANHTITLANVSAGRTVGVGTAAAGNLSVSDAELGRMDAGGYVFGSGTAGLLTADSLNVFNGNLTLISNHEVVVENNLNVNSGVNRSLLVQSNDKMTIRNVTLQNAGAGGLGVTLQSDAERVGPAPGEGYIDTDNMTVVTEGQNFIAGGSTNPLLFPAATSGFNDGIDFVDSSINTGAGSISVRGEVGDAGGNFLNGVDLDGTDLITTSGSITISGTNNSSGTNNYGVNIGGVSSIRTGTGAVNITGTTTVNNTDNHGVLLWIASLIEQTGVGASGAVTLTGSSAGNSGNAVRISDNGTLRVADANLTLSSTNGDIFIAGPVEKTNGGASTLTISAEDDILTSNPGLNTTITATAGNWNMTLSADSDADGSGVLDVTDTDIVSNGGTITLRAAGFDFDALSTVNAGASTIRYAGSTGTLNVGGAGGTAAVDDAELGITTATAYLFGEAASPVNVAVNTAYDFGTDNVSFLSNGNVSFNGAWNSNGTGDVLVDANGTIAFNNTFTATDAGSNLTLDGGAVSIPNVISLAGDLDVTGPASIGADITADDIRFRSPTASAAGSHTLTTTGGGTLQFDNTLTATLGSLTLASNDLSFAGNVTAGAGRSIAFTPVNGSDSLGVGTGAAGVMVIDDSEIAFLNGAGEFIFTTSGNIEIDAVTVPSELSFYGAAININGHVNAGANTVLLDAATGDITNSAGTLTATSLNLDAAGTISADINATNVNINNNSTMTTLTGLVGGAASQAAANTILGGPGNDPLYTFAGFIIRAIVIGGGGGSGGASGPGAGNPVIPDPVDPAPPVAPVSPAAPVLGILDILPTLISGMNPSLMSTFSSSVKEQRTLTTISEVSFYTDPENQPYEFKPALFSYDLIDLDAPREEAAE